MSKSKNGSEGLYRAGAAIGGALSVGRFVLLAVVIALVLWLIVPSKAKAEDLPFKVNAQTVLVVDAETNEIILDKNAQDVRSIASITKLMTAVVVLDANLPLDEEIVISQEEVEATMLRKVPTSGSLPVGVKLTRAELLHLALMNSQNRAAAALARTYPGGAAAFIAAMNNKAAMLGMYNTQYVDPTGLFNDNISTARDLAILVRHASDYVLIKDFSTATVFELTTYHKKKARKIGFGTTNGLVHKNDWNIVLQKTGYIKDAGRCVVMMASMGAKKVIVVLLNAVSNEARAADASNIKYYVETGRTPLTKQKPERKKAEKQKPTRQKATKERDRG